MLVVRATDEATIWTRGIDIYNRDSCIERRIKNCIHMAIAVALANDNADVCVPYGSLKLIEEATEWIVWLNLTPRA